MALENCPKCGGEIKLYSRTSTEADHNCFVRCGKCNAEYPMPEAHLVANGVRIYPSSIKKAERCWNRRAATMRQAEKEAHNE